MLSKDAQIAEFQRTIERLTETIGRQKETIERLEKRIDELELELARAKKDSSTSSKPPSSDIVKPPKPDTKAGNRRKRRKGGQPGHKQHLREPLPPERVDEQITYEIKAEDARTRQLTPTDEFEIIQHIELVEFPIHVTEYRLRKYVTPDGETTLPDVPELTGKPIFGPRMLAMIAWLKSRAHCSYTTIEVWMQDVLQVPVSRGYLSKLCTGVISESLADAHEELTQAIPRQSQLGSDETSFKNNGKKHWIWCITASAFTLYHIAASRSREVLEKLIGEDYRGHLNFDYYSANCSFAWHFDIKAQYCWAHLIRDIRFLLNHPNKKTRAWGEQLLDRSRRLFTAWHRRDEMTKAGFFRSMMIHRDRFLQLVRQTPGSNEATNLAARFAMVELEDGSFYDMSQDYFRFMFEPGVEPTNNHPEQQIRHCVIDRHITQGTRSEAGQRYHERMWTAIATCQKQDRSFFSFLYTSIAATLTGQAAPSLLPS
jgi:transposase